MNSLVLAQVERGGFWMPEQASTHAADIDFVFFYIYWMSVIFFVAINAAMFYFIWKYRRRTRYDEVGKLTHSTPLEITWSIIPSILLVPMFWWGFQGFMDSRTMPSGTYDINVTAAKWTWTFTYPNGLQHDELHIPADRPTKLIMRSTDVIHSVFIPEFRAKQDVVPGRYTYLWFYPTKAGEYHLTCTEYCGTNHSDMKAKVVVHPTLDGPMSQNDWLKNDADPYAGMTPEQLADWRRLSNDEFVKKYTPDPVLGPKISKFKLTPVQLGESLYKRRGCIQCHSLDGKIGQGPSWKDVYGTMRTFDDKSTAMADENYLLESIRDPYKHVVAGFTKVMPSNYVTMPIHETDALIAYIKTLSSAAAPAGGSTAPASSAASASAPGSAPASAPK